MMIKEFKLGNTKIEVDDTYFPKTKEENEKVYEEFNRIGCEILRNTNKWKKVKQMKRKLDKNKIYSFIGQAVVYASIWALSVTGIFYAVTNCITVYR